MKNIHYFATKYKLVMQAVQSYDLIANIYRPNVESYRKKIIYYTA